MRKNRTVQILTLTLGLVLSVGARAAGAADANALGTDLRSTRIFKLQEMDTREAVTLLRAHVQVRQIAELRDLEVVIVTDAAESVDRCDRLLRDHEAIAEAIDPHEPLRFDREDVSPTVTRVFRIDGLDTKAAVVVLRAIYQIRAVTEREANGSVTVTAPESKLEAIEALLRALDVLVSS